MMVIICHNVGNTIINHPFVHCFAHINGIRMTLESSDLGDLQVDFSWQPREAVEDYVRRLPEDRVGWTVG